eukprot:gene6136-biopygen17822
MTRASMGRASANARNATFSRVPGRTSYCTGVDELAAHDVIHDGEERGGDIDDVHPIPSSDVRHKPRPAVDVVRDEADRAWFPFRRSYLKGGVAVLGRAATQFPGGARHTSRFVFA